MNTKYDLNDVIRLIRDETLLNIDTYVSFLVNGTIEELKTYMNLYLCHKIYDTPYGDMVPLILSNALGLTLLILSKTAPESHYEVRPVGNGTKNHLLVYKYQDHYDAIVVKSELNTSPTTNQMMVVCLSPSDFTENCSGVSLLFHDSTTASECLNSSGGPENLHGQRFSTKPVATVNITVSDVLFIRKICCITLIKKEKVKWDTYRKQRNLTTAINKQSKSAYFQERCDGGPKKQSFWKTIKPFISDKGNFSSSKINLHEGDTIINDAGVIFEIFNDYFACVANSIGFDDSIPTDYYTDEGFSSIRDKYCRHPSIVKIKENTLITYYLILRI